ncbi:MAG: GNAT family N-acetyltransferase [Rhodospirillaceae bacterium]
MSHVIAQATLTQAPVLAELHLQLHMQLQNQGSEQLHMQLQPSAGIQPTNGTLERPWSAQEYASLLAQPSGRGAILSVTNGDPPDHPDGPSSVPVRTDPTSARTSTAPAPEPTSAPPSASASASASAPVTLTALEPSAIADPTLPLTPCGFIVLSDDGVDAEILMIGVLPKWQRHGFGRLLVQFAQHSLRAAGRSSLLLEVAQDNGPAIALYRSEGFTQIGRRLRYYRRPEGTVDALMMKWIAR